MNRFNQSKRIVTRRTLGLSNGPGKICWETSEATSGHRAQAYIHLSYMVDIYSVFMLRIYAAASHTPPGHGLVMVPPHPPCGPVVVVDGWVLPLDT